MGKITQYLGRRVLAMPTQVLAGHTCLGYEGAYPLIEDTSHFSLAHVAWAKAETHCAGMVNVIVDDVMGTLMFVLPTGVVADSSFVLLPSGILCLAPLAPGEEDRFPENDAFARCVIKEDTFLLDTLSAAFRARWRECGCPTRNPVDIFSNLEADDSSDEVGDDQPDGTEPTATQSEPLNAWFFESADGADAVVFDFGDHFVTIRHLARPSMDISLLSKAGCPSASDAATKAFHATGRLRPIRTGLAELFQFAVGGEVLS